MINALCAIKLLVIGSCTHDKDNRGCPAPLTQADFADPSVFQRRTAELSAWALPARELYTGRQHLYMMKGVDRIRNCFGSSACSVKIVSAGYGLVDEEQLLVPYEATFQKEHPRWIEEQSNRLGIPTAVRKAVVGYDVVLFLLGKEYLISLHPPLLPNSTSDSYSLPPTLDLRSTRTQQLFSQAARRQLDSKKPRWRSRVRCSNYSHSGCAVPLNCGTNSYQTILTALCWHSLKLGRRTHGPQSRRLELPLRNIGRLAREDRRLSPPQRLHGKDRLAGPRRVLLLREW
jgi:hypothetical protein